MIISPIIVGPRERRSHILMQKELIALREGIMLHFLPDPFYKEKS